ncbi:scabin-related ADP-ribosyltransferase [Nonomuraea sp. NPDC003707]
MGLELPEALRPLVPLTGHTWTDSDEVGLAGAGMRLARFGDDSTRTAAEADDLTSWVRSRNDSEGVRAFHDDWRDETGLAAEGESVSGTTVLIGLALLAAAVIVIVYKLTVLYSLMRLVMRLSATIFLPGAGAAAYEAEKIVATRLRGTFGEMFTRMVLRPLVKASERLGAPMARKPGRWPASFHGDRLHAAARRVDLGKLGVSNPVWRTDRRFLWRGDDRHPDEIFEKGFHPKGDRVTLSMHQDQPYDSAFVSTTRSPNLGLLRQQDYRYLIDAPGGLNLNRTLRRNKLRNGYPDEREVAFPGGIDRRYIVGAQEVRRGRGTYRRFIPNPHYDPGS